MLFFDSTYCPHVLPHMTTCLPRCFVLFTTYYIITVYCGNTVFIHLFGRGCLDLLTMSWLKYHLAM